MVAKFLLALIPLLMLASAQAIPDTLYFSMTNDTEKCFQIMLPDDARIILPGKIEYTLTMSPGPRETWSSLSVQIVRTDENNTAVIPVCFRTFGRVAGECAKPWSLSIRALGIPTRTVSGGVCVSAWPDIDFSPPAPEQTLSEGLNTNIDIFDLGFTKPVQYGKPGDVVVYTLDLESYAQVILDLTASSSASISPAKVSVALSPEKPTKSISFELSSDSPGEYELEILAKIRDCDGSFCQKKTAGKLIVKETVPEQAGWSISLFPQSLNVKELIPVAFELTVTNNGPPTSFDTDIKMPEGMETDFVKTRLEISQGESKTQDFTVTPMYVSSLYEIRISVSSADLGKSITGWLSTNEMLTDSFREKAEIDRIASPQIKQEAKSSLDDFYSEYKDSESGTELGAYSNLKNSLAQSKAKAKPSEPTDITEPTTTPVPGFSLEILAIVAAVIVIVVVGLVYMRKRKKVEKLEF